MIRLTEYILEKLKIHNATQAFHKYHPKTKDELIAIIKKQIFKYGYNVDLNDIDVSQIDDFSLLFINSNFDGDISEWNVSNVKNMYGMFYKK